MSDLNEKDVILDNKSEENVTEIVIAPNEKTSESDKIELYHINKDFLLDIMSVPTHSKMEYRMVTYIVLWCKRNNVKYEFDEFGNIYLTKGILDDGEYYPCVTSHLDTVQTGHDPYIYAGVPLDLEITLNKYEQHILSVNTDGGNSIGIGADDKSGICICLSLFAYFDKLKACFFLDEETGCNGSNELDTDWFNNVGYVIGYDSPDLYRAAWSCSGTKLFSYEFYEKYMKEVCDSWGVGDGCFFSEPYTDVKKIREKTGIICMNFGNGGYKAHASDEYCIMEDMDQACGMGIELIEKIGLTRHYLKHQTKWESTFTYEKTKDGYYNKIEHESDIKKLESLGDNKRMYNSYTSYGSSYSNNQSSTKKEDEIKFETVKYIVERYDSFISSLKAEITEGIKNVCADNELNFDSFEKVINEKFDKEIKF